MTELSALSASRPAVPGSALVAGTPRFLKGAVPEGVDGGRARFARYARTVAHRWPAAAPGGQQDIGRRGAVREG
ncbi:hypothetical protein [Streptomyces sp. NBC_01438]|uniref:hypothetical protein n=1 Tax=Streptomyces sp. NBC_01438 TaxID=2903866 RepID=UPI0032505AA3